MQQSVLEVLDVRDRALVELLDPALLDQEGGVPRVVRHDDDVAVDRLPTRERALDLPEEGCVVVDVLDVVDLHARLFREHVERWVLVPLLVVDVQRPVREAQSLRESLVRP
jgi:hypothetical protein